jgi:hypothetical protein
MSNLIYKSVVGNDIIEFVSFNFDGKGNAIIRRNGDIELLDVDELFDVLFGAIAKEKEYVEFKL